MLEFFSIFLGLLAPALLIIQAFLLSRNSKGFYRLGIACVLYTMGALWAITALTGLAGPAHLQDLRNSEFLPKGVPLYAAFAIVAQLLVVAPGAVVRLFRGARGLSSGSPVKAPVKASKSS